MSALLVTDVSVIVTSPFASATVVNCWMLEMFSPPDAATKSKFVSTCVGLISALIQIAAPLVIDLNAVELSVIDNIG
jgi:hypothetical protein